MNNITNILSSLGEPSQLKIALYLYQGRKNQTEIIKFLNDRFQTNVSRTLMLMIYRGVLKSEKQGKFVYYEIASDFVRDLLKLIITKMEEKNDD